MGHYWRVSEAGTSLLSQSSEFRPVAGAAHDPGRDAISALVALGYKPQEASRMVSQVRDDEIESSEELIKAALRAAVS